MIVTGAKVEMLKSLKTIIWVTSKVLYYDVSLNKTLTGREQKKLQLYVGKENCLFDVFLNVHHSIDLF
jgi:hypothetical protein